MKKWKLWHALFYVVVVVLFLSLSLLLQTTITQCSLCIQFLFRMKLASMYTFVYFLCGFVFLNNLFFIALCSTYRFWTSPIPIVKLIMFKCKHEFAYFILHICSIDSSASEPLEPIIIFPFEVSNRYLSFNSIYFEVRSNFGLALQITCIHCSLWALCAIACHWLLTFFFSVN